MDGSTKRLNRHLIDETVTIGKLFNANSEPVEGEDNSRSEPSPTAGNRVAPGGGEDKGIPP
ncbi:MAG: hypothetical protein QF405_16520 [Roseibacillus sp.]|jgi:hypothetical protein|nr:hypothetical protein [Roseibacillus sp.]MDP7309250.1 hypothetical protein [Roseibacillus sp.]MDP7656895.1 hypothetical protein [Roseibacillus sp.]HJM64423.1 hypothetical protein [Roseibacillus sp.]